MAEAVVATVHVAADPDRVFDFFTHPELMVRWMGEHAELDGRPGGRFAVDVRGTAVRGRFVVVERPSRLVFTWGHAGSDRLPPGASTVEVRLRPLEGGTLVELEHRGLGEPEASGHRRGWQHFLARLAADVIHK